MRLFRAAAAFIFFLAPARAATLGPTAQTLEAIHGSAVNDPARFFDGMDSRVRLLEPVSYSPLPALPEPPPAVTTFNSREIAPGLTLHEPVPPTSPKPADARDGSSAFWMIAAVVASVALAAALILLFL